MRVKTGVVDHLLLENYINSQLLNGWTLHSVLPAVTSPPNYLVILFRMEEEK